MRLDQIRLGAGAIAALIVELAEPFETERVVAGAGLEKRVAPESSAVSATRIASGSRLLARSMSSLSLRMLPQLFVAFHFASPTLAQLANEMAWPALPRPAAAPAVRPYSRRDRQRNSCVPTALRRRASQLCRRDPTSE